jgi:hypothetical protein
MVDGPGFPPPTKKKGTSPYRASAPRTFPRRDAKPRAPEPSAEASAPALVSDEAVVQRSRRWGCVLPIAIAGVAASIGGASLLHAAWSQGTLPPSSMFLLSVIGGPGLLLFAFLIYRDPDF